MTTENLDIVRDNNGFPTYALKFTASKWVQTVADTAYEITIPADATIAIFNASGPFWVDTSDSGYPTSDVVGNTTAKLAPSQLEVRYLTSIWVKARAITDISVSFYGGGAS